MYQYYVDIWMMAENKDFTYYSLEKSLLGYGDGLMVDWGLQEYIKEHDEYFWPKLLWPKACSALVLLFKTS